MAEIRWDLVGPPVDIMAAVQSGYQRGRSMRLQAQQESAFGRLARNPNDPEGIAELVASGDPQTAWAFQDHARTQRRQEYARAAFGGGAVPGAPTAPPSAFAAAPTTPMAGAGASPVLPGPPAPAPSPAPASEMGQLDPALIRQFYAEDPDGARDLVTTWNQFNTAQRAAATQRFTAAVPVLMEAARVPYEQRRAFLAAQAPDLLQNGWSQQEIESFDPTDQNVRLMLRRGIPIAQQREIFQPIEGSPGNVYRDPFTLGVDAANPSPSRDEHYYDENGNEVIRTIPGTPAIGPGADLFGAGVSTARPAGLPQPGSVVNGHRYRGPPPSGPTDPALRDRNNWEPVEGGAGQPQAQGTFP